jgi:hypothetical protein
MRSITQSVRDRFTYKELRLDESVFIVTTCKRCGASQIVSEFDGSLEEWEREHSCRMKTKASNACPAEGQFVAHKR